MSTTELEPEVAETAPCPDPECDGTAEPEQDGDHQFLSCTTCGFEFGYKRVEPTQLAVDAEGHCAIGVPVGLRAAVSGKSAPIALGATIPIGPPK